MPSLKGIQNHMCRICTKIGRRTMFGKGGGVKTIVRENRNMKSSGNESKRGQRRSLTAYSL